MGQEEALLPAPATVAFSWEQDQGVLKPVPAQGVAAPDMPESPRKAPANVVLSWEHNPAATKPDVKPRGGARESGRKPQAPTRRLSVPPPPGRASARGVSRAVRPEDDPFLAAYLACTKSTGGSDGGNRKATGAQEPKKGQRRSLWAGLGLGGLSCKRDGGVVEQSMVSLAKLPELDPRDA